MQRHTDTPASVCRMLWLPAGRISRVNGRARLRVTRGLVWLTVDGQLDDHLLEAGERFVLRRGDRALLQVLDATAGVEIVERAPATWRQWFIALLRDAGLRLAGVRA